MTAAHALDALEPADARAMEDHLRTCDECRVTFDEWKETANSLAFAAETADPSAASRVRVLQQVSTLGDAEIKRDNGSHGRLQNKAAKQDSNVIPLSTVSRHDWNRRQAFGAIAASLIIVFLAVALAVIWQRNRAMQTEMARLSRQSSEAQQELARIREEKRLEYIPAARVVSLEGTEMAKGARAMLAYDRASGHAWFRADGLPRTPAGKAYQLWFIMEGKPPMPGGVFKADSFGHSEMNNVIPLEGRGATAFAVTLERAGGVTVPEGQAYLKSSES